MAKVMGRPTSCTAELIEQICNAVGTSVKGLFTLCTENSHWPDYTTIRRWIRENRQNFCHLYAQAKEDQIHLMAEEILDIADDTSRDTLTRTNKDGDEYEVANNEWINRSRLRVDARKWLASKLLPKVYGDRSTVDSNVTLKQEEAIKDLE